MATLVPGRLRGRYLGIRNSAANLTNLISIPLLGLAVSAWPGGTIQGYGALLLLGVVLGLISLVCQRFMTDVNPQEQFPAEEQGSRGAGEQGNFLIQNSSTGEAFAAGISGQVQTNLGANASPLQTQNSKSQDPPVKSVQSPISNNFMRFLLFFGFWTFAANVSSPFFNLYLLDDLKMDVTLVTLYNSLSAGANLLMLVVWGIAPTRNQASYFAIAAAVAGVGGALATTVAGFMAQFGNIGGLPGLFAISAVLRLMALLPLLFVREQRSQPLAKVTRSIAQLCVSPKALLLSKPQLIPVKVVESAKETGN